MSKLILMFSLLFHVLFSFGQNDEQLVEKNLRINFINPGVEYEMPLLKKSSILLNVGVGFGGSYKNLTTSGDGFMYLISPFYDVQYRYYYNIEKRNNAGKPVKHNSANFVSLKLLSRGPELASSFSRTTEIDFAFGPYWGIQRSFNQLHVLFDIGPCLYFDMKGNYGILPMFELNIGYNLFK